MVPRPLHVEHAPYGLLKENRRGVISGKEIAQALQAKRWLYRVSLATASPFSASTETIATSVPYLNATPRESARRASIPARMISAVDHHLDGVRVGAGPGDVFVEVAQLAVDPRAHEAGRAQLEQLLRYSPLRPRTIGARTCTRLRSGSAEHRSTICCTVCGAIGRPQRGQCGCADAREQQAQVVVDLGDRADGRARVAAGRFCSMAIAGDRPSIESTSGFSICSRNWRA